MTCEGAPQSPAFVSDASRFAWSGTSIRRTTSGFGTADRTPKYDVVSDRNNHSIGPGTALGRRLAILAVVAAVALAGCGSDNEPTSSPTPSSNAAPSVSTTIASLTTIASSTTAPTTLAPQPSAASSTSASGATPLDDLSQLVGIDYRSVEVRGHALLPGSQMHLWVTPMHILGAMAACNSVGIVARIEQGRLLSEGPQSGSLVGCDPAHEAEDAWLADFLTSNPAITLDDGRLTLTGESTTIIFEAAG